MVITVRRGKASPTADTSDGRIPASAHRKHLLPHAARRRRSFRLPLQAADGMNAIKRVQAVK